MAKDLLIRLLDSYFDSRSYQLTAVTAKLSAAQ